jgi:hypothetical protein
VAVAFRSAAALLAHLQKGHPNLAGSIWRINSPADDAYQCIAWAACQTDRHMWPHQDYWWFSGCPLVSIPDEAPLDYFIQGFAVLGYMPCGSRGFEFGYQKLAIYANEIGITHMARQHFLGRGWLSKLGVLEDIVHQELEDVAGDTSAMAFQYGEVVQIVRRSWWVAIRKLCLFHCFWHACKHWLCRIMHPSWNRSRWNTI